MNPFERNIIYMYLHIMWYKTVCITSPFVKKHYFVTSFWSPLGNRKLFLNLWQNPFLGSMFNVYDNSLAYMLLLPFLRHMLTVLSLFLHVHSCLGIFDPLVWSTAKFGGALRTMAFMCICKEGIGVWTMLKC